jgi:hypothetical protein
MDLAERKRIEVMRRLDALDAEFNRWLRDSERGERFQKHHTQIRSVAELLQGHRERIGTKLRSDPGLSTSREMSRIVLALFRIWEFFRAKFAQRLEMPFLPYLQIADEFAWLCYKPVYDNAIATGKRFREPPLVYLNGGLSPFILTRDTSFQAEAVPGDLIRDSSLQKAMARLPFPVIGIPWYQITQLPDILVVAHEVGHSIEADFNLTPALNVLIESALKPNARASRLNHWVAWLSEVFADFCGCLGGGPAFVTALADFLLADRDEIIRQAPGEDSYPPANVRVRINASILEKLNFATEAQALLAKWNPLFPLPAEQEPYVRDAGEIITRLIDLPFAEFGGRTLPSILRFDTTQQRRALEQAGLAFARKQLKHYQDVRLTLAAARLAYETNPVAFFGAGSNDGNVPTPAQRLEQRLSDLLFNDLRNGEQRRSKAEQKIIDQQNRNIGESDFDFLLET